jgi:hypothetical protein
LQVPDQGRRLIVSHEQLKGSKSSATGLEVIVRLFRGTVRPRSDSVSFVITLSPSPGRRDDPRMGGNRA